MIGSGPPARVSSLDPARPAGRPGAAARPPSGPQAQPRRALTGRARMSPDPSREEYTICTAVAAPECSVAVVLAHGPAGRGCAGGYGTRPGAGRLLRRCCGTVSSSLMSSGTSFDDGASGREGNQPGAHAPGEALRGRHLQLGHAPAATCRSFVQGAP